MEGIPAHLDTFSCSQGPSGTVQLPDGTTKSVMVTAAHCVTSLGPGYEVAPEVYVPKMDGNHVIGYREQASNPLVEAQPSFAKETFDAFTVSDWSTITLLEDVPTSRVSDSIDFYGNSTADGVALTGIRDYADLGPYQVSLDNFGQPICKDGMTSGRTCGTQLARTQHAVFSWGLNYTHGDSGGNNYDPNNGEVIGVTSQAVGPIGRAQPVDAALQAAYGIPDGEVNEHFTLAESTEAHDDDFRPLAQDEAEVQEWYNENPPVAPVQQAAAPAVSAAPAAEVAETPDYRAEFHADVEAAQNDAADATAQIQNSVFNGDVESAVATGEQALETAAHHAQVLPESAANAATQEVAELVSQ